MKKIILNVFLVVVSYFLPLYMLYIQQEVTITTESIGLIPMLICSIVIIYLNDKYRRQAQNSKWQWVVFEIIGVVGLLYSAFVLFILFGLRNCCGF